MKIHTLLFFSCAIWIAMSFARNCAQFNPNNFNVCAVCADQYYLVNGKCALCTNATSNLVECAPKTSSNDRNQSTTSSTILASNLTDTNASLNESTKNETSDVNVTIPTQNPANNTENTAKSKGSEAIAKITNIEVNSTDSNITSTKTNDVPKITQTTIDNNTSSKKSHNQTTTTTQQTSPLSLLQMLTQSGLVDCAQFSITTQGIVCTSCKENFCLTSDKLCAPCAPANTNTKQVSININTKDVKDSKTTEVNKTNVSGVNTNITSNNVNDTPPKVIETKITSSTNQVVIKETSPQPQATSTTFIPPIPTSSNSQGNSSVVQNSILPSFSLFYSFPTNNNVATNPNSRNYASSSTNTQINTTIQSATTQQNLTPLTVRYPTPNKPTDPNCLQPNPAYSYTQPIGAQNKRCLRCFASNYYNIYLQQCNQINPKCKTVDDQNNCLSCYPGYDLSQGDCIIGGQQSLSNILITNRSPFSTPQLPTFSFKDPNCNKCAPNSNQCILCAKNYYLYNGACLQVNPLCRTYNGDNGDCRSCYQGYSLNYTTQPVSCSISVMNDCKTYDRNSGNCQTCYIGYYLSNGACKLYTPVSDPYCTRGGPRGCQQCIQRFYPDENGSCKMVSLLCAVYNLSNGVCTSCILLYTLVNGQCVYQNGL